MNTCQYVMVQNIKHKMFCFVPLVQALQSTAPHFLEF